MSDPMQEIRASFFVECDELLEALQDGLADLEGESCDPETINVVFRAVHSIKGGAGAFGLEDLVGFAHTFETVLDELRSDRLEITGELTRLLFRSADALSDLVRAAREDTPADMGRMSDLLSELGEVAGQADQGADDPVDFQPAAISMDLDFDFGAPAPDEVPAPSEPPTATLWTIGFTPHPGLFAAGHEPLFLLRGLGHALIND